MSLGTGFYIAAIYSFTYQVITLVQNYMFLLYQLMMIINSYIASQKIYEKNLNNHFIWSKHNATIDWRTFNQKSVPNIGFISIQVSHPQIKCNMNESMRVTEQCH